MERLLDAPLEDLLHALRLQLRERAAQRYYTEVNVWAALAPHQTKPDKPPALPEILR